MQHFLITVRIRRGSSETVREILREGPPFDLSETSLERHSVFSPAMSSRSSSKGTMPRTKLAACFPAPTSLVRRAGWPPTSLGARACLRRSSAGPGLSGWTEWTSARCQVRATPKADRSTDASDEPLRRNVRGARHRARGLPRAGPGCRPELPSPPRIRAVSTGIASLVPSGMFCQCGGRDHEQAEPRRARGAGGPDGHALGQGTDRQDPEDRQRGLRWTQRARARPWPASVTPSTS